MKPSKSEAQVCVDISFAMIGEPIVLFRNTVGAGYIVDDKNPSRRQWIEYGLEVGSSDLIGYITKEITPDMVGKKVAIFTACEVKKEDWKPSMDKKKHHEDQENFIRCINLDGGIAAFVRSVEEFNELILNRVVK
jgi:hypothetical protein